jgi:hypothetical protein
MSDEQKKGMPRRIALRVIGGGVPATLAIGRAAAAGVEAGSHVHAGAAQVAPPEPGAYEFRFLTEAERETAALLADMIIPRDDVSGSATEAGVVEYVDEYATEWSGTQVQLRGGLRWLDRECSRRFDRPFAACDEAQRRELLDLIAYPEKLPSRPAAGEAGDREVSAATPDPELERLRHGVEFFTLFRNLVAGAFYTSRIGIDDLQFTGNVPTDWHGCPPHVLRKLGV